jgi:DNA-binding beta-propeller fold protein YncE
MDNRRFDDVARRVGALAVPRLPRRGLLGLIGGAILASALGLTLPGADPAGARQQDRKRNKKKDKTCKKEGKRCAKNKDCCRGKCQRGECTSGATCRTGQDVNRAWGTFGDADGQFKSPYGIAVDPDGEVYVADRGNNRIQVFDANGNYQRKWGERGSGETKFISVRGVAVNHTGRGDDRAYVSDPGQSSVDRRFRKFSGSGTFQDDLGRNMSNPLNVTADINGNIWVVDTVGRVFLFDSNGGFGPNWQPSGDGDISGAEGIAVWVDEKSNRTFVYIARTAASMVYKFEYVNNSANGLKFKGRVGSFGGDSRQFRNPAALAADKCGNLWVSDTENDRIQKLDKDLNFRSSFTAGLDGPAGIALNSNGTAMYVADTLNNRVVKFDLK